MSNIYRSADELIGKTPLVLYDPQRDNPILYEAGDYIRFVRISAEQFEEQRKKEQEAYAGRRAGKGRV